MKYIDSLPLLEVDRTLEFETDTYSVSGGCDLYSIKPAGTDKRLYLKIEARLQRQHKELQDIYNSLPQDRKSRFAKETNLNRQSPFGCLENRHNRNIFIYIVATMNATWEDHDFSNVVKPEDFRRTTRQEVMQAMAATMYNLRPNIYNAGIPDGAKTPCGTPVWQPKTWKLIDEEMDLGDCEFWQWAKDEDVVDGEEGALFSQHFFFYNRGLKRLCYLYLRAFSRFENSPPPATSLISRFKHKISEEFEDEEDEEEYPLSASFDSGDKRKKRRCSHVYDEYGNCKACLDDLVIDHPGMEVVDAEEYLGGGVLERQTSMEYPISEDERDTDLEELLAKERKKKEERRRESREKMGKGKKAMGILEKRMSMGVSVS